jgi:hypothetical protein
MRNNRKAALFLTDNQIPVYEGDIIKVFISKEDRTGIHWYPRCCDYKTPDMTRLGGKSKYFCLEQNEYAALENTRRLKLILEPTGRIHIYRVAPEKRKPLLRLPIRGTASPVGIKGVSHENTYCHCRVRPEVRSQRGFGFNRIMPPYADFRDGGDTLLRVPRKATLSLLNGKTITALPGASPAAWLH